MREGTVWVVIRENFYKGEKYELCAEGICGFFGSQEDAEAYAAWEESEYPATAYFVESHDISRTASDAIEHKIKRRSAMDARAKASLEKCLENPHISEKACDSIRKALEAYA